LATVNTAVGAFVKGARVVGLAVRVVYNHAFRLVERLVFLTLGSSDFQVVNGFRALGTLTRRHMAAIMGTISFALAVNMLHFVPLQHRVREGFQHVVCAESSA